MFHLSHSQDPRSEEVIPEVNLSLFMPIVKEIRIFNLKLITNDESTIVEDQEEED